MMAGELVKVKIAGEKKLSISCDFYLKYQQFGHIISSEEASGVMEVLCLHMLS